MGQLGSDTINPTGATSPRAPADVTQIRKLIRRGAWLSLAVWAGCLAILALPTFYVVRYGGLPPGKLLPGIIAFPILTTALPFAIGVSLITRATSSVSTRPIYWHAAVWVVVLAAGTLLFSHHVAAIGWRGAEWVQVLGAAAIVGGLPLGAVISARLLAQRAKVASSRAQRATRQQELATAMQWSNEVGDTYKAIQKWYGRNSASTSYGLSASETLTRLLKSDELAETNPARLARLRDFRSKVESGTPLL